VFRVQSLCGSVESVCTSPKRVLVVRGRFECFTLNVLALIIPNSETIMLFQGNVLRKIFWVRMCKVENRHKDKF
jgi:hypothetical protein